MSWTKDRPFQALALTGGGYRGLFTARALQEMEDHIEEPIGRRFDLSVGDRIELTHRDHAILTHS